MTARRSGTEKPIEDQEKAASTREAKGSVQEAIGKLIGDDAMRKQGTAEKEAGATDASDIQKSSRP